MPDDVRVAVGDEAAKSVAQARKAGGTAVAVRADAAASAEFHHRGGRAELLPGYASP
ncbi:hypothetical protein ACQEVC_32150 [Plantactinospora sp. CA-294935]|uniref:hypothetical protein n=1 Tax=Plantactinospora sp. CA-294935 TaxID=3240012 RepID=UPI003D9502A2